MRYYGIIGYPLTHTQSPLFHNTLFQYYNIDADYQAFPIQEQEVASYINKIRHQTIHGLSVTAPYKYLAFSYCNSYTPYAQQSGLVNTLSYTGYGIHGDNFDVIGIKKTIELLFQHSCVTKSSRPAIIVGTGATATSAIIALLSCGIRSIYVLGRNREALSLLSSRYNIIPLLHDPNTSYITQHNIELPLASILISTIPVHFISNTIFEHTLDHQSVFFDVHYHTPHSSLSQLIEEKGIYSINGYYMFLVQAILQFITWTGIFPQYRDLLPLIQEFYNSNLSPLPSLYPQ